jgi:AcrR family transcriptional regulator
VARTRKHDRQATILQAAIEVIAERGLSAAPTSAISKAAGVAEGTLFTYFATKHELANALYCEIKLQLADALLAEEPSRDGIRGVMQHHWDNLVRWGVANPRTLLVLDQLTTSGMITAESSAAGSAPFAQLEQLVRGAVRSGVIRRMPFAFLISNFESMAQNTIRQINAGTDTPGKLRRLGFEILWRGVAAGPDENL